jgi:hypothetical protein
MGVVMINCPNTGQPVSTGIETDTESFASLPALADDVPSMWGRSRLVDAGGFARNPD